MEMTYHRYLSLLTWYHCILNVNFSSSISFILALYATISIYIYIYVTVSMCHCVHVSHVYVSPSVCIYTFYPFVPDPNSFTLPFWAEEFHYCSPSFVLGEHQTVGKLYFHPSLVRCPDNDRHTDVVTDIDTVTQSYMGTYEWWHTDTVIRKHMPR